MSSGDRSNGRVTVENLSWFEKPLLLRRARAASGAIGEMGERVVGDGRNKGNGSFDKTITVFNGFNGRNMKKLTILAETGPRPLLLLRARIPAISVKWVEE